MLLLTWHKKRVKVVAPRTTRLGKNTGVREHYLGTHPPKRTISIVLALDIRVNISSGYYNLLLILAIYSPKLVSLEGMVVSRHSRDLRPCPRVVKTLRRGFPQLLKQAQR